MAKRTMQDLKDMLCRELDEYAVKGKIAGGDLQAIHLLTDTIKNIGKIEMIDEGYSGDDDGGRSYGRGSYGDDRGYSGREHYVRAHYSRDDGNGMVAERIGDAIDSGRYSGAEREILNRAMRLMNMR